MCDLSTQLSIEVSNYQKLFYLQSLSVLPHLFHSNQSKETSQCVHKV